MGTGLGRQSQDDIHVTKGPESCLTSSPAEPQRDVTTPNGQSHGKPHGAGEDVAVGTLPTEVAGT